MIHPSAEVSPHAEIGEDTRIWNNAQVRERAQIGRSCIIGKDCYIDAGVQIGNNVKIQNGVYVYHGVTIEDGVFVGPRVCFTNDLNPRAINPDGSLKSESDWQVGPIQICYGASLGAGAIILPNITIGRFALVGAGAVVSRSVPDHGLVFGNPARLHGFVCRCAKRLIPRERQNQWLILDCGDCQQSYTLETHYDPDLETALR